MPRSIIARSERRDPAPAAVFTKPAAHPAARRSATWAGERSGILCDDCAAATGDPRTSGGRLLPNDSALEDLAGGRSHEERLTRDDHYARLASAAEVRFETRLDER